MKRATKPPSTRKKPVIARAAGTTRAKTNGLRAPGKTPSKTPSKAPGKTARKASSQVLPVVNASLDAYLTLLEEIWTDVHPLIGAVTLSALFRSAARRLAPAHPCVASLQVPIEGVDRANVLASLGGATPAQSAAALRDLVRDLLTLFESIAGPVIVRLLLPKIVRAETVV